MSVLVKGMEKPEHCGYCRFRYDGICHAIQKTQYSMDECPLVGIDDVLDTNVGDIISRQVAIDAILKQTICATKRELVERCDANISDENGWLGGVCIALDTIEDLPSAQPEIEYRDCANAMLRMWMDNVVTDGEYNRIMAKLNVHWGKDDG